jgi:hypothetical protein
MLFVVIFSVLEVRGTGINMVAPMAKDPAPDSKRVIILCQDSKIVPFNINLPTRNLLETKKKLTYNTIPQFVKNANKKNIQDNHFIYQLEYKQWEEGSFYNYVHRRAIVLVIDKIPGQLGETIEEIESSSSEYVQYLKGLDNVLSWIAFMVDEKSIAVFRKAREIAIDMGFAIGWDPGTIEFPYKEVVAGTEPSKKNKYTPKGPLTTTQN